MSKIPGKAVFDIDLLQAYTPLKKTFKISRTASWLIIISITVVCLIYFRSLLEPFVLSLFIWYLISAFRNAIGRINIKGKTLPLWLQASMAFMITFGVLWGFWEILSYNVQLIIEKSGTYNENISGMVQALGAVPFLDRLPGVEDVDKFILDNLSNLDLQSYVGSFFNSLSSIVGNFALIVVYVIFMLIEENLMPAKIEAIFKNEDRKGTMLDILRHIGQSINTYFAVKTSMSLLTAILSYIVMLLFGLDFAVLWAFLIFLFNYIPYVGSLIATLLPALFAIFQFASFWPFLWILIAVESVQIFVGNYVEPKVMGKTLNLSPLIVVMALSFWGAIWGIVGMILSVPIISVLVIILSHFPSTRNIAIFFSEQGSIENYSEKNGTSA